MRMANELDWHLTGQQESDPVTWSRRCVLTTSKTELHTKQLKQLQLFKNTVKEKPEKTECSRILPNMSRRTAEVAVQSWGFRPCPQNCACQPMVWLKAFSSKIKRQCIPLSPGDTVSEFPSYPLQRTVLNSALPLLQKESWEGPSCGAACLLMGTTVPRRIEAGGSLNPHQHLEGHQVHKSCSAGHLLSH